MRRIVSIAFLICFSFYHFGYYAFYYSFQYSLESKWKDKIYSDQIGYLEERIMDIPLSAPYMSNQENFQATNTRFEKDGKYFRAIKQRYQNDTLKIVYVPDTARKSLDSTVKKWISFLADDELPLNQNGKTHQLKVFIKDYIQTVHYEFSPLDSLSGFTALGFIFSAYKSPFFHLDTPPPQLS
ncbi:hypothetical protein [Algoriphagus sp. CAU 1675]|uniref:hypothetical protein n=1 Tax=Algoriphagus sp. CAU 1675 TaxID=3032597 RepID=UPI0023DB8732|nr:hypothetical protein [Algoriphagus sp. CAU 1675]MDF2158923.1 hypothetical protein [Algoriphagus sp. CAU 1675]